MSTTCMSVRDVAVAAANPAVSFATVSQEDGIRKEFSDEVGALTAERDELKSLLDKYTGELSRLVDSDGDDGLNSIVGIKMEMESLRSRCAELDKEVRYIRNVSAARPDAFVSNTVNPTPFVSPFRSS